MSVPLVYFQVVKFRWLKTLMQKTVYSTLSFIRVFSPVFPKKGKKRDSPKDEQEKSVERIKKYPSGIFYILGTEFVERFSFYCFQGILTLYLSQELKFSDDTAASIYHAFMVLSYFSPVLGAIMADAWLGLFWTIFYISILFAIGNFIVAIGATPMSLKNMTLVSLVGLFTVGLATGGIKPCVSTFGGSQFEEDQVKERHHFFSLFFFAINTGSILPTIISPELRATVHCFGKRTCYPLAFGFPAIISAIVITLFVFGKPLYKIRRAKGSEFVDVFKCMFYALKQKFKNKEKEKRGHWLNYAADKYDSQLIFDIKSFLQVIWIYMPLPIFWMLYEQQGSTWILQAAIMDGKVGTYNIKPDQMQIINSVLIIVFIPMFNSFIYPFLMKCGLCKTPLQRMATGGLLIAISFVITGFVQLEVEKELPGYPPKGSCELEIINNSPCKLDLNGWRNTSVMAFKAKTLLEIPSDTVIEWEISPSDCSATNSTYKKFHLPAKFMCIMIALSNGTIDIQIVEETKKKDQTGEPRVKLHFSSDFMFTKSEKFSFRFDGPARYYLYPDNIGRSSRVGWTDYCLMAPGLYRIYLPLNESVHQDIPIGEAQFKAGGSYVVAIHQNLALNVSRVTVFLTVMYNSVHMLYQFPQILLLTAGEAMFEVTGLEFSFCEAPESLKSMVQGIWFLTNGIGNAFFIIAEQISPIEKLSGNFFMYAIIMIVAMLIFSILGHYFVYVDDRINQKHVECS